jgi:multiple sugar transport system permease protein
MQITTQTTLLHSWYKISKIVTKVIVYMFLLLLCAVVVLPIGWMLTVSLKPDLVPVFTIPPEWLPTRYFEWSNFLKALTTPTRPFLLYTRNTLIIFAGNVVGAVISCSLVAFAFARLKFRGSGFPVHSVIITRC